MKLLQTTPSSTVVQQGGISIIVVILIIVIIAMIYFFMMRNKKEKPHNVIVKKGQAVISIDGSIRGKVEEITDSVIIISIENNNVFEKSKDNEVFKIDGDGTIIRI